VCRLVAFFTTIAWQKTTAGCPATGRGMVVFAAATVYEARDPVNRSHPPTEEVHAYA